MSVDRQAELIPIADTRCLSTDLFAGWSSAPPRHSVSEAERRLVFAGARFSLWRANDGAVDEIKGDKAGIGYRRFAHDTPYSDVPVELANGAAFYLTTDGLIDQVGGPRHRSFGKKRFRAFVAAHQGRPMPEQAEALRQTLRAYQGEQVRRDDVTVLGFSPNAA